MSVSPKTIMKKITKYNIRVDNVRIDNVPVISKNVEEHGPSAAKHKKKEEDDLEDCNDHNYYKPTPRMNENSNKYSMLYNALTSHTKNKQCNRNIIEQTYSEISMPLHDDEVLSDVYLVETSTSSSGVHSSHNQVADENTPHKRRLHNKQYCAISTQVKMKSNNEKNLLKRKKILEQKLKRQNKYIDHMKSLLAVVKKYTSQSDIENIIKGNFTDLCKLFKKSNPPNPQGTRYSDEVKAFAFMLHFHSPKAYELLRSYVPLPHTKTLRKSIS